MNNNPRLRRAKALRDCRAARLIMRCMTAPAYDKDGNGRGACATCGYFPDIKAGDLADGKVDGE